MIMESIKSSFENLYERFKNPFLNSFLIVLIIYNWQLLFTLLNFDDLEDRAERISIILKLVGKPSLWDLIGEFCIITGYALLLIFLYSLFSNISLGLTTAFNRWVKPFILKLIDQNEIISKEDYDELKGNLDRLTNRYEESRKLLTASQESNDRQLNNKNIEIGELKSELSIKSTKLSETSTELSETSKKLIFTKGILERTEKSQNKFKVLYARYGAINKYVDVTSKVAEFLENDKELVVNNQTFEIDDPKKDVVKDLFIVFQLSCTTRTLTVNENAIVELRDDNLILRETELSQSKQKLKATFSEPIDVKPEMLKNDEARRLFFNAVKQKIKYMESQYDNFYSHYSDEMINKTIDEAIASPRPCKLSFLPTFKVMV